MVRAKRQLNGPGPGGASVDELPRPLWIFFYGEAVELLAAGPSPWSALAEQSGVDLAYCTTAWQRRGFSRPPADADASSLLQFWQRQCACWQVQRPLTDDAQAVTIRCVDERGELGWRETLEMILSAATFELSVHVQLAPAAWRSLLATPDQRQAWQQLLDFDLATLEVQGLGPDPDEVARGVRFRRAGGDDAESLERPWVLLA
jgi:hypothetical protein